MLSLVEHEKRFITSKTAPLNLDAMCLQCECWKVKLVEVGLRCCSSMSV